MVKLNNSKQIVVHLGFSGFPIGNAEIQRIKLNYKSLKLSGFLPLIINKHSINSSENRKRLNVFDGIPYTYTSRLLNRPDSFISRNLNKITGLIGEFYLLIKKRKKIHTAILYSSSNFTELIYYRILSKLFGFKLLIQYVEFRSSIDYRKRSIKRFNDILYDNFFYLFCDGVIAISEFLKNHVSKKKQSLPVLKLPVVCNFESFDTSYQIAENNYIMYCGTIAYSEVIEFIIDIFTQLRDKNKNRSEKLLLIISGKNEDSFARLMNLIKLNNYNVDIIVKSNIKYEELTSLYAEANVLLIPLRNNIQDLARFPHKIGEYTASKRPILSNNIGELEFYFRDNESALLVEQYSVEMFTEKLDNSLQSKELLDKIGKAGYEIGIKEFDYKAQADELKRFILEL